MGWKSTGYVSRENAEARVAELRLDKKRAKILRKLKKVSDKDLEFELERREEPKGGTMQYVIGEEPEYHSHP